MAQESCNLDKEEPEILKPSSPSNPSTSQSTTAAISNPLSAAAGGVATAAAPASLCSKPPQELSAQKAERPDWPETSVEASCRLKAEKESRPPFQYGNRCTSCKRKVGLTGFRCRCGDLFCSRHRYSETHDCSFDYKALGREEISKTNPVIRAAKIIKI